ncbi:anaerobic sulfatase maturase [Aliagarivorans marinus]|uniref:anaerobic sulfatase maturase n=1 Tax=Aliagarivorans marinus TaxID=561965 RepID=UPI0004225D7E|nr:anaerobic sulfatase maturase [Aliagarivorans marinus]
MSEPFASLSHCRVVTASGSRCVADSCDCFHLERDKLDSEIDDSQLECLIQQYIEANASGEVTFCWQGGEPTLMGLAFFNKVVGLQQRYSDGRTIRNVIQTDGTRINDEWCEFFRRHEFLVVISIDGPADLHDFYRLNKGEKATYRRVMDAIERLKLHGVRFSTLTIVHAENAKFPKRMYDFLVGIGSKAIQFVPLVEKLGARPALNGLTQAYSLLGNKSGVTQRSVSSDGYGRFLSDVFDRWLQKDVGQVHVDMFDSVLSAWCDQPSSLCVLSPACGYSQAPEANGNVYHCLDCAYPQTKSGSIHKQTLAEMKSSATTVEFSLNKQRRLTGQCQSCSYRFACHGGCPKHRFSSSQSGEAQHNYLCEGFRQFFRHSASAMRLMRDLIARGRAPSDAMFILQRQQVVTAELASSSDVLCSLESDSACKCGSGM